VTRLRLLFACAALAVVAACGGPQVPPAANYGTITGRVFDAATGQPIAGVTVKVDVILVGTSGSDGRYQIGTVPIGTYQMDVPSPPTGYTAPNLNAAPFAGSVLAGQTIVVDIPLTHQ
jgi:hypothetical protein